MPRVVGLVDGTHLECVRPINAPDAPYIGRKGYPSINAMGVVDNRKKFIAFLASFPGSCHDSYVIRYAVGGGGGVLIDGISETRLQELPLLAHDGGRCCRRHHPRGFRLPTEVVAVHADFGSPQCARNAL